VDIDKTVSGDQLGECALEMLAKAAEFMRSAKRPVLFLIAADLRAGEDGESDIYYANSVPVEGLPSLLEIGLTNVLDDASEDELAVAAAMVEARGRTMN
jgi:hypothetical protein